MPKSRISKILKIPLHFSKHTLCFPVPLPKPQTLQITNLEPQISQPSPRDCGKDFLTAVVLRLKAKTLSPGDYLYEAGEFGDSMYFLTKGLLEMVIHEKLGLLAELKEGAYVGESCVLGLSETRQVSIRATTWCNLFR